MKIDFSTIFLLIFLVLPGLFSRRSQNSVAPKSLEDLGATEELAEFVVQGLSVHLLIAAICFWFMALLGFFRWCDWRVYFRLLDSSDPELWMKHHASEAIFCFAAYVLMTFLVGHLLGLFIGVWRLHRPVTSYIWSRFDWMRRFGIAGSLGERPIIYDVLDPELDKSGNPSIVFVEVEMKSELGFYAGQVSRYAVVKDSEAHKQIYITETWFKLLRNDDYVKVDAEGILLDLADVATLRVKQQSADELDALDSDGIPE
ncbi:MAG TPA: DUF6338 family protein [Acidobacteriaceae bacterium]|nr:DUF6338 family protein [Acidobacteriaceae bacterium]